MPQKKTNSRSREVSMESTFDNLPWPGLKARDRLSRIVTRAVKEAKEAREKNAWAKVQIARVLDNVPPQVAMKLVLKEISRRGGLIPRSVKGLLQHLAG